VNTPLNFNKSVLCKRGVAEVGSYAPAYVDRVVGCPDRLLPTAAEYAPDNQPSALQLHPWLSLCFFCVVTQYNVKLRKDKQLRIRRDALKRNAMKDRRAVSQLNAGSLINARSLIDAVD